MTELLIDVAVNCVVAVAAAIIVYPFAYVRGRMVGMKRRLMKRRTA